MRVWNGFFIDAIWNVATHWFRENENPRCSWDVHLVKPFTWIASHACFAPTG
ncbi:hypothetical protein F0726_00412 [Acidithiobacillus caldus]|nr:hypothetical protein F0726_00412 [Acidithiobacillus caldus]